MAKRKADTPIGNFAKMSRKRWLEAYSETLLEENEEFSSEVMVEPIVKQRIMEMETLAKFAGNVRPTTLVNKFMPRHMRRRAASHNPKRFPSRLRKLVAEQRQKDKKKSSQKKASRRYRRKPSNLNAEYAHRQRSTRWLPTHIWHAKRFHVTERWGYKLPLTPCDKGYRAIVRALKQHSLIFDMSYLCCFELSSSSDVISVRLSTMLSEAGGVFLKAALKSNETALKLQVEFYDESLIGPVDIAVHPESECRHTVWIWLHPTTCDEVRTCLIRRFALAPPQFVCSEVGPVSGTGPVGDIKLTFCERFKPWSAESGLHIDSIPLRYYICLKAMTPNENTLHRNRIAESGTEPTEWLSQSGDSIVLRSLQRSIARFRLVGRQAGDVIAAALHPPERLSDDAWWTPCLSDDRLSDVLAELEKWRGLGKLAYTGTSPPALISALCRDPRATLPHLKRSLDAPIEVTATVTTPPRIPTTLPPPLCNPALRDACVTTMPATHEVNTMRRQSAPNGGPLAPTPNEWLLPTIAYIHPNLSMRKRDKAVKANTKMNNSFDSEQCSEQSRAVISLGNESESDPLPYLSRPEKKKSRRNRMPKKQSVEIATVNQASQVTKPKAAPSTIEALPAVSFPTVDLILPMECARFVWLALIYQGGFAYNFNNVFANPTQRTGPQPGCRAGGQCELATVALECADSQTGPAAWPDTRAGRVELWATGCQRAAEYLRRPPSKRPNFASTRIAHPFAPPWGTLARQPSAAAEGGSVLSVLRGERLHELARIVDSMKLCPEAAIESISSFIAFHLPDHLGDHLGDHLVPIRLTAHRRVPHPCSVIYLPGDEITPLALGPNEPEFEISYDATASSCDSLSFPTVTKMAKVTPRCTTVAPRKVDTAAVISELNAVITGQSAPRPSSPSQTVLSPRKPAKKRASKRKYLLPSSSVPVGRFEPVQDGHAIIGYVFDGNFSNLVGRGIGSGYVTLSSIRQLIEMSSSVVLVRNTDSLHLFTCSFRIG